MILYQTIDEPTMFDFISLNSIKSWCHKRKCVESLLTLPNVTSFYRYATEEEKKLFLRFKFSFNCATGEMEITLTRWRRGSDTHAPATTKREREREKDSFHTIVKTDPNRWCCWCCCCVRHFLKKTPRPVIQPIFPAWFDLYQHCFGPHCSLLWRNDLKIDS